MPHSPLPAGDPTQGAKATPMAFIQAIVAAYRRYGRDPAAALARAHIAPQQLADDGARVTAAQMELMSGYAMQELDDEALGWFSRRLPWGSYGMLCRASLTAPNLGLALKRWCRHHRLLTEDIALSLQESEGEAALILEPRRELGEMSEFCQVTCLRYVLGYACWLVDSRIPLRRATFPFAAPAHGAVYPLIFPGPVAFEAGPAALRFDAAYLALPLRRDEAALRQMLARALSLTVLQYRRDRLLVQRVRQVLAAEPESMVTAEAVAARLHLSSRSLHRQLREEGAALQELKDEVRRGRAVELLQRTDRPVKQVARDVGFRNEKSFARAFRQWTGLAPGVFRAGGSGAGEVGGSRP